MSERASGLPIGPEVASHAARRPERTRIEGRDVVLVPIDVAAHGPALYALSHGPEREAQWLYLWDGPYPSEASSSGRRAAPWAWRPICASRRRIA
jgi:hypothetical protein